MKVASMTEFPSNISDNIRTVAPQDAITAGFFALRDMDPDAVCPNNRERFARQCDHCIAEAVISAAYPLFAAQVRAEGEKQFAEAERVLEQAIRERDEAEEWADKLAAALAGDTAGEHSSANNPWQNALDLAAERDARVRAEERQRVDGLIAARLAAPVGMTEYGNDALVALRAEIAAGSAVPVATPEPSDETRCHRCGGKNCTWSAPSPLWNEVMRGGDINGPWQWNEIICPPCFAELAEAAGIAAPRWRFSAEQVLVPLATSTPSGRVWDEAKQLWVEPVATPTEPGKCRHDRMGGCGLDGINEPVAASRDLLGALQASIDRARQEPEPRPPLRVMEAHLMQDCTDPAVCWYEPHRSGARRPAEQDGQR